MNLNNTPFFSMLKSRMEFLNERQKVLAQNVANVSTPKYTPKDLDENSFQQSISREIANSGYGNSGLASAGTSGAFVAPVNMVATSPTHFGISTSSSGGSVHTINAPDSETTLDGNSVVVEEQMMKVSDTRMNYDIALTLYQKGLSLLRMASKSPGS